MLDEWINDHHGNVSIKVRIPGKLEKRIVLRDASGMLQSTSLVALYLEDREFLKNMYQSYTHDEEEVDEAQGLPPNATQRHAASRSRRNAVVEENVYGYMKNAFMGADGYFFSESFTMKNITYPLNHRENLQKLFSTQLKSRTRRDTSSNRKSRRKSRTGGNRKRWYRAPRHEQCQMWDFKVDFDFIGWGQWIITPKQFNAGFCYGECPSPLEDKFKPTNHAMLQTLMRQKRPRLAPPTCCVPVKLRPLSMLYFEYDEIVVRHHENMIATECGCR